MTINILVTILKHVVKTHIITDQKMRMFFSRPSIDWKYNASRKVSIGLESQKYKTYTYNNDTIFFSRAVQIHPSPIICIQIKSEQLDGTIRLMTRHLSRWIHPVYCTITLCQISSCNRAFVSFKSSIRGTKITKPVREKRSHAGPKTLVDQPTVVISRYPKNGVERISVILLWLQLINIALWCCPSFTVSHSIAICNCSMGSRYLNHQNPNYHNID